MSKRRKNATFDEFELMARIAEAVLSGDPCAAAVDSASIDDGQSCSKCGNPNRQYAEHDNDCRFGPRAHGAAEERAAIVAWLRDVGVSGEWFADHIESGEHRKGET